MIKGVEELEKVTQGNNPQLRRGQILFGTVSLAHHRGVPEESLMGKLTNSVASILLGVKTGEFRKYPYLHAAVYAGKHAGRHYVIENGGAYSTGIGMVSALPIEEAFEADAKFLIISPPKDSNGRSTRYLVLQRALAGQHPIGTVSIATRPS